MKTAVMLPTYNEAGNIERVVEQIVAISEDIAAVVVDDNSPDGTGDIADNLANRLPGRVHVVHRQGKRGRGVAGVEGFKYCLSLSVDYVVEMDADLSHDPQDIPALLRAAESADVVLGSRYVEGGGEVNRELSRRVISRLANTYLRLVLGVRIRDCSSGYRCFRRNVLQSIGLDTIASTGPSIVTEVLWRCKTRGFRIAEVPIVFHERAEGISKLDWRILVRSLIIPVQVRLGRMLPWKVEG